MKRILVQCQDLATYQRLAQSSDDSVPVLGSRADDAIFARALGIECIEMAASGPHQALDSMPAATLVPASASLLHPDQDCVLARSDQYLPFALALARWTARKVVLTEGDLMSHLGAHFRSVLIVGVPEAFPFSLLVSVAALTVSQGSAPEIGIITGRSAGTVSRRIARLAFAPADKPARTLRLGALATESIAKSTRAKINFDERIGALLTVSHGSSIDMDLAAGVLCGRASHVGESVVYPCRFEEGCRRSPTGDREIVHIDRLDAQVIFAESCNCIAIGDGLFPDDVSLALSAMEGAASLIGTCKLVRSSQGLLPSLAGALLASGYRFGAVTSIVNRAQAAIVGDAPSYLLIGDPRNRLVSEADPLRLSVDCRNAEWSLTFDISCDDRCARVLEVEIVMAGDVGDRLSDHALQIELMPPPSPDESGIAMLIPINRNEARLYVCMDAVRQFARVRAVIGPKSLSSSGSIVAAIWRGMEFLSAIREGVASNSDSTPTGERCVRDLDELLERAHDLSLSVTQLQQLDHPHISWFNGAGSSYADLLAGVCSINRELASLFPTWGLSSHLAWAYSKQLAPEGRERPSGSCVICKSPCFEIDYASSRIPWLRRTIRHCPRCGILSDCPVGSKPVDLLGPTEIVAGSDVQFEWLLRNDQSFPTEVAASTAFPHTPPSFSCKLTPDTCVEVVAPNREVSVQLKLECSATTPPGIYSLVVAVASALSFQVAARPLRVKHLRPSLTERP
jgi:hypothetical protein